ncbi:LysR family transcriptional regulator [Rummeliibacillus pycnus]|uniref:LysR family transcriptional regulator n=1 Tax=Rummeliibacillus pycnus TaxID=101070 RepID=UPI003D28362D
MDIRQLRYFVEVAKQKSFTKASNILFVSQPSISKIIKGFEAELKVTLLDRSEKKVELTDVGKVVYEQALEALRLVDGIASSVNELVDMKKGNVKLGLMPTVGVLLFPTLIGGFKKQYPQIDVQMVEYNAKLLEHHVENSDIDFGVTVLPVSSHFETVPLLSEELVVIVNSNHQLVGKDFVRLEELKNESFILFTEDFILHDRVKHACIQAGFNPKVAYTSSLWDLVGEMVASKLGISLVPKSMVHRFNNPLIHAITISKPLIDWELALIYKKDKYLSYTAREFIYYIQTKNLLNH